MAYIVCKDASFDYEGETVVSALNFTVNKGDYVCIVGENGSGKTTLLNGILRLKQPQTGSIEFEDALKPTEIGYLPQQKAAQKDFPASVYEVVLSGRLASRGMRPFYTKTDRDAAEENARRLGIGDLLGKCYRELSGGQQQRVLLARSLCAAKKMLLLDEPAAGLDPVVTQDLYHIIEEINKETGMAVIMVSHDIPSALKYAGFILHLNHRQEFFGTAADYAKSDAAQAFFTEKAIFVNKTEQ
jgi:zinc transport system ATP-binding protein